MNMKTRMMKIIIIIKIIIKIIIIIAIIIFFHNTKAPSRPGPRHYRGFTIPLRRTTLGRRPLEE